jgi:hypothetical protein
MQGTQIKCGRRSRMHARFGTPSSSPRSKYRKQIVCTLHVRPDSHGMRSARSVQSLPHVNLNNQEATAEGVVLEDHEFQRRLKEGREALEIASAYFGKIEEGTEKQSTRDWITQNRHLIDAAFSRLQEILLDRSLWPSAAIGEEPPTAVFGTQGKTPIGTMSGMPQVTSRTRSRKMYSPRSRRKEAIKEAVIDFKRRHPDATQRQICEEMDKLQDKKRDLAPLKSWIDSDSKPIRLWVDCYEDAVIGGNVRKYLTDLLKSEASLVTTRATSKFAISP